MTLKLGRRVALKVGLGWAALMAVGRSTAGASDFAEPDRAVDSTGPQARSGRTHELAKQLVELASQALPLTNHDPKKIEDQLRLAEAELGLGETEAGRVRLDWLTDQIEVEGSLGQRVWAWARLAELRSLLKDRQASQAALAKAFQEARSESHQRDRDDLFYGIAHSLVRMGRLDEALRILQAFELETDHNQAIQAELLLGHVRNQVRAGDLRGGLATIASWPALKESWFAEDLVQAFWSVKDPNRLLVLLKAFEDDYLRVRAGLALGKAGYLDQAIGVFRAVGEPSLRAAGALSLAEVLVQSGLDSQPVPSNRLG